MNFKKNTFETTNFLIFQEMLLLNFEKSNIFLWICSFLAKKIFDNVPKLKTPQPILPDKISIVGSIPPIKVICLRISGWQVISFKIFSDPSWHFGSSVSSKFVRISKPPESMIANWTWSFLKSKSCYSRGDNFNEFLWPGCKELCFK